MRDMSVSEITLPEAYHQSLVILEEHGELIDCPAWNTTCKEISMGFTVFEPLREPMISKFFVGGFRDLESYTMAIVDGIEDWQIGKGREYTYHDRFAGQYWDVIYELFRDPNSRRAKMVIALPDDIKTANPPCLQHIQYFIRNGRLDCYVYMRSNDALEAAFMNAYAFIRLQEQAVKDLNDLGVKVKMGKYVHRALSFHVYEKDFDFLRNIVQRIKRTKFHTKLCYRFRGDWDELMEAERPLILADMDKLRKSKEVST